MLAMSHAGPSPRARGAAGTGKGRRGKGGTILARPGAARLLARRGRRGGVLATGEAYSRPAHHKKGSKPRRTEERQT
ncbi:hypothetical protein TPA0598_15_00320 [Streptomyces lydicamycinicus]|uniref:Uncharacterized protein n=1 Tax=Streptomyces lydicamycinicus TaxID=1546107 RepID=A0A0P4RGT4_9ACTN|nr:hypothetical protein TPA0598_15_00320 [Streptomyces lydicamycinicus]